MERVLLRAIPLGRFFSADFPRADSSRAMTAGSRARLFDGVKPRAKKQRRAVRWVPLRNQRPIRRLAFHQSFVGAIPMDENRMSGAAKNLGEKMEEGYGRATGDAKTRLQGQMRQAEGSTQELYGQAVDSAEDAIDAVRRMPASADDSIRHFIESNPSPTAPIASVLHWLIV